MDSVSRLIAFGALLLGAFGCPVLAWGQTTGGVVRVAVIANQPQSFSSTGDLLSHVTYEGRLAAASTGTAPVANSLYYRRAATFSKGTVAALARKRMLGMVPYVGPVFLLKDLLEAGGLFGDTAGAINSAPSVPGASCSGAEGFWMSTYNYLTACSAAGVASKHCANYTATNLYPCIGFTLTSASTYTLTEATPPGQGQPIQGPYNLINYGPNGSAHSDPATAAIAATDDQIVNAMKAGDPTQDWVKQAWAEPFKWPEGQPIVANPMPAQMAEVAAQYRTDTGVALAPATTDPVYADETAVAKATATSDNIGTQTKPETSSSTSSGSLAFPVFCTWASVVCEAVTWFKAEPTTLETQAPELPEIDVPVTDVPFVSGLGAGTCPGGVNAEFSFFGSHVVAFSYQPMCDFAALIKPLFILMASILSAMILAGLRKSA